MFSLLIVENNTETVQLIKSIVEKDPRIQLMGVVSTGEEAIEFIKTQRPRFLLANAELPGMNGFELSEHIAVNHETAVIMMSSKVDQELFRMAMKSGAQDFLLIPFSVEELNDSMQRVCKRQEKKSVSVPASAQHTCVTATFFSTKGGVGKTFISVNVATMLKERFKDKKICLLDFNIQFGNICSMLNINTLHSIVSLAVDGKMTLETVEEYMVEHKSGIKVLQCSPKPVDAERVNAELLRNVIEILKKNYDYIIIDSAVSFREEELSIFDLSDHIMLVGNYEVPTIGNLKNCLEILSSLQHDNISVIFNMKPKKVEITGEHVEKILKRPINVDIPFFPEDVVKLINQGKTLLESENKELQDALHEVIKIIAPDSDSENNGSNDAGFMGKIKKIFS